jgi:hypothetical protein
MTVLLEKPKKNQGFFPLFPLPPPTSLPTLLRPSIKSPPHLPIAPFEPEVLRPKHSDAEILAYCKTENEGIFVVIAGTLYF